MAVWDWVLEAYARPGVPEACLHLQDVHGQNTSLLLWAVWAQAGDPDLLTHAADAASRWEKAALVPLREVRRALKTACPPVPDPAREGLRVDVKAAELRAERVLIETLEDLAGESSGGARAFDALKAASRAWPIPAPDEALASLAAALR